MVYIESIDNDGTVSEEEEAVHLIDNGDADDDDPKQIQARLHIQNEVQMIVRDEQISPNRKIVMLAAYMADKHKVMRDAQKKREDVEARNKRLWIQVNDLNESNMQFYEKATRDQDTINELRQELKATQANRNSIEKPVASIPNGILPKLQETEQELKDKLESRNSKVSQLENNLIAAKEIIEEYKMRLGQVNSETSRWAANLQRCTTFLTMENLKLRKQFNDINHYMAASHVADAGRWDQTMQQARQNRRHGFILQQYHQQQQQQQRQQQPQEPSRTSSLTYGSLDSDMRDDFEVDTQMTTTRNKYLSPVVIRMRRRLARTKTRARRSGSSVPRVARPAECRKGYSERRAASTYLQYRDGQGKEDASVLKLKGRNIGMWKFFPRKRTRLEKGSDMIKRIEAVSGVRRLSPLTMSIRPWVSPNPYHRRDDAELAKRMSTIPMSESVAIQAETPEEAKLVTIARTVEPFIPRSKEPSSPRYLPKHPRALSTDERRQCARVASKWTLGPAVKKPSKKQVRFANDVEYEPDRPTKDWTLSEGNLTTSERSFSWSQLIIAIFILLLFLSNTGTPKRPRVSWEEANRRPSDIVARLRTPGRGDSTSTIIDFEVARWSDIDASVPG